MVRQWDPLDVGLAVAVLRGLRGWDPQALADAAGVAASTIYRIETGERLPTSRTFDRIVAAVGIAPALVDRLFAWIRSARASVGGSSQGTDAFVDDVCGEMSENLSEVLRAAAALVLADQPDLLGGPKVGALGPSQEARQQAPVLWGVMRRRSPGSRRELVEDAQEFRSWALCELVCAESVKAAADNADRAVELAELAVLIADLAPGAETWRWRLQGYAWAHLGNARRVRGELPEAEEAFSRGLELWQAGAPGDPGLLSETQVLSLEASLRTSQDRLAEASAVLDRALANPGSLRPNLLIKQARVLEWSGDYEGALATLRQVGPLSPDQNQLRLVFALRFNSAWNLTHLGRFAAAEGLLPEVQALTAQLDNKLDALRLRGLEGRVAAGLGRAAEAAEAFSQVRAGFAGLGIAYDAALATLELAVVHLEQDRTREVKTLARQMAPIFKAQGGHRGALAALKLFCEAAEKEAATVELARRVVDYLYRAQHNRELRFQA